MLLPKLSKSTTTIIYKLLHDTLFLLLLFLLLALIAEGLIAGIITSHISFLKITFLIFLNLLFIYLAGYFLRINSEKDQANKKIVIFLTIIGIFLVFNSLLKLNILLAIFLVFSMGLTGYFIYRLFFPNSR